VAPGPHGKGGLIWAVQRSRVSRTGGQLLAGTPGSVLAGTQVSGVLRTVLTAKLEADPGMKAGTALKPYLEHF
jgi:hypothetical protein